MLWLYELCRFLIAQCNSLIVGFLFDTPPCSASTCPEMRASEWQFLCAVHEQPKSCCAIDYCCHTLDWAANVVTDQKLFPSRFAVLNDANSRNAGVKSLVNVFRRLHRIFAHAWFQHRSVFWSVEGQRGLYVFFKTVCDLYDLLPAEIYKLPPEAEGLDAMPAEEDQGKKLPPIILKPPSQTQSEEENVQLVGRTNTRRHIRSSPSTGSAVTTVIETEEEDSDGVTQGMENMHISAPELAEEEAEVEVPVMVEQSVMAHAFPQDTAPRTSKNAEVVEATKGSNDGTIIEAHLEGDGREAPPVEGEGKEVASPHGASRLGEESNAMPDVSNAAGESTAGNDEASAETPAEEQGTA